MIEDVLIDADTLRSPEMRHEIAALIVDPLLYGERDGVAFVAVSPLDVALVATARPEVRRFDMVEDLNIRELVDGGLNRHEALLEVRLRACRRMGLTRAVVPPTFPLATAEHLRRGGIELVVDHERFAARRRRKSAAELEGIRRATRAAEAGLTAASRALAEAEPHDGVLHLHGAALTCERLHDLVREAVGLPADIVVIHGPQTATGHGPGSGPIAPGEPVIVDLSPQDRESACYADIARTFVKGEPHPEIVAWHALASDALEAAIAAVKPGVDGHALWGMTCDRFEAAGHPTPRRPGENVMEGFPTALGHGVGLEIHEDPSLGRGGEAIQAGDVLSIEPFLCRPGFGGVQVEDILLVTETGAELLSTLSRELAPVGWPPVSGS